jgi:hypothetical protein
VPSLPYWIYYFWLDVGAGGYVGEAEHFPASRQGNGGSAGGRACPIVHISTGASVWMLSVLTAFAPFARRNDGAAGMDLSTGANQS